MERASSLLHAPVENDTLGMVFIDKFGGKKITI